MSAMNEDCFRKSDYQNPPLLLFAFNMKIRDTLCPSSLFCRAVEREWESRVGLKRQLVTGANSPLSLSLSLSQIFFLGGGGWGASVHRLRVQKPGWGFQGITAGIMASDLPFYRSLAPSLTC